jgi:hypothetical protein
MYQGIAVPPSVMLIMPFASVGHVVDAVGRSGGVFPPEAVVPLLEPEPLPEPDEWEPLEPEPLPELDDCVPPEPEPPPELVEGEPLLEFPPLEFPPLEDPPFVEPSSSELDPLLDPPGPPEFVDCDPHEGPSASVARRAASGAMWKIFEPVGMTVASPKLRSAAREHRRTMHL